MFTKRYFKTKDEVEVTFEMPGEVGRQVEWVSESTGWEPMVMTVANRGKGPFKLKVRLPKDQRFQFRYRIDGDRWENDSAADDYWFNGIDAHNSVVSTV